MWQSGVPPKPFTIKSLFIPENYQCTFCNINFAYSATSYYKHKQDLSYPGFEYYKCSTSPLTYMKKNHAFFCLE